MKILKATLKHKIETAVDIQDLDFNKNLTSSVSIINEIKARTFLEIKQKMHEKIATLSLEDIEFNILN